MASSFESPERPNTPEEFVAWLDVQEAVTATEISALLDTSVGRSLMASTAAGELENHQQQQHEAVTLSCKVASAALGESVLRDDAAMADAVKESWSQACWSNSSCIIRPKSAQEVARAMKIIAFFRTPFAVRSGGHSPNPGFASISSNGILIDLSELKGTKLSSDRSVLSVGPGARWAAVYEFLDSYGVTVLGGRVPEVGVGGYILGGGVSHFSGEHGLGADSVQNFEVVLGDGRLVNANKNERSDLYWALKGGGPNFGIVTRIDLQTFPIKNIWFESSVYAPEMAHSVLEAFATWQKSNDTKASVILAFMPQIVTLGLVYSAPVEKPAVFKPFYDLPSLATPVPSTIGTVFDLSNILAGGQSIQPARHDYRAASSKIDIELYKEVYDFWLAEFVPVQAATGANMTFVLQHISKNLVDKGNEKGGNTLGLESVDQQWWTTIMDWTKSEDDDKVRNVGVAVEKKWKELSLKRKSHLPTLYMNDASRDQDPLGSYPEENVRKLRAVSQKYDPWQVFQKIQNDGFLLSNM